MPECTPNTLFSGGGPIILYCVTIRTPTLPCALEGLLIRVPLRVPSRGSFPGSFKGSYVGTSRVNAWNLRVRAQEEQSSSHKGFRALGVWV